MFYFTCPSAACNALSNTAITVNLKRSLKVKCTYDILETKAFAESDMSLCAPFLAFDPVMQFVVGVGVLPTTCGRKFTCLVCVHTCKI